MKLNSINNDYDYELEKLCRLFLPFERIDITDTLVKDNIYGIVQKRIDGNVTVLSAYLNAGGKESEHTDSIQNNTEDYDRRCETLLCVQLFECFADVFGYKPEWGVLTGIRPAKLYSAYRKKYGDEADRLFKEHFVVSDEKMLLCRETLAGETAIINQSEPDSFSLYVSIPFCPSRCSYCSFVSHSVDKAKALIPQYLQKLSEEIKITADIAKRLGLKLKTVYIGGGTPTTLSPDEIETVMGEIAGNFDLSNIIEYTVEAGRPDTVTEAKLKVIKKYGATRISINPQTMIDSVLEHIGRRHTAQQTADAFALARSLGFDNINMDLIAGLPTDTLSGFCKTLDEVIKLGPENVTVHSLSLKRASAMTGKGELPDFDTGIQAAKMVSAAHSLLTQNGIMPYYMYRQSKTVGNLENVGYAKKGLEGYYNVYIMDETHTILSCGASAVTKLKEPYGKNIRRIFNYKYPYEYINRFDEIKSRKASIEEFYEEYPVRHN